MFNVYMYVLDTMADWEVGYISAELNSKRFFKKDAPEVNFKTVGVTKDSIKTMGGLTVVPDCTIEEIEMAENTYLLLPGADVWSEAVHVPVIQKAKELLSCGGCICAICGATVALAHEGILDNCKHTSNGEGFLEMFCPAYKGTANFVDAQSVSDKNLITASATGGILWTKQIIEKLGVFKPETLEAWHKYFSTNKPEHFFALMQSLDQH